MKFKELRERAKMRQAELGTEVGVGQTTVSAWESGRFEPRAGEIKKIARAGRFGRGSRGLFYGKGGIKNDASGIFEGKRAAARARRAKDRRIAAGDREVRPRTQSVCVDDVEGRRGDDGARCADEGDRHHPCAASGDGRFGRQRQVGITRKAGNEK